MHLWQQTQVCQCDKLVGFKNTLPYTRRVETFGGKRGCFHVINSSSFKERPDRQTLETYYEQTQICPCDAIVVEKDVAFHHAESTPNF